MKYDNPYNKDIFEGNVTVKKEDANIELYEKKSFLKDRRRAENRLVSKLEEIAKLTTRPCAVLLSKLPDSKVKAKSAATFRKELDVHSGRSLSSDDSVDESSSKCCTAAQQVESLRRASDLRSLADKRKEKTFEITSDVDVCSREESRSEELDDIINFLKETEPRILNDPITGKRSLEVVHLADGGNGVKTSDLGEGAFQRSCASGKLGRMPEVSTQTLCQGTEEDMPEVSTQTNSCSWEVMEQVVPEASTQTSVRIWKEAQGLEEDDATAPWCDSSAKSPRPPSCDLRLTYGSSSPGCDSAVTETSDSYLLFGTPDRSIESQDESKDFDISDKILNDNDDSATSCSTRCSYESSYRTHETDLNDEESKASMPRLTPEPHDTGQSVTNSSESQETDVHLVQASEMIPQQPLIIKISLNALENRRFSVESKNHSISSGSCASNTKGFCEKTVKNYKEEDHALHSQDEHYIKANSSLNRDKSAAHYLLDESTQSRKEVSSSSSSSNSQQDKSYHGPVLSDDKASARSDKAGFYFGDSVKSEVTQSDSKPLVGKQRRKRFRNRWKRGKLSPAPRRKTTEVGKCERLRSSKVLGSERLTVVNKTAAESIENLRKTSPCGDLLKESNTQSDEPLLGDEDDLKDNSCLTDTDETLAQEWNSDSKNSNDSQDRFDRTLSRNFLRVVSWTETPTLRLNILKDSKDTPSRRSSGESKTEAASNYKVDSERGTFSGKTSCKHSKCGDDSDICVTSKATDNSCTVTSVDENDEGKLSSQSPVCSRAEYLSDTDSVDLPTYADIMGLSVDSSDGKDNSSVQNCEATLGLSTLETEDITKESSDSADMSQVTSVIQCHDSLGRKESVPKLKTAKQTVLSVYTKVDEEQTITDVVCKRFKKRTSRPSSSSPCKKAKAMKGNFVESKAATEQLACGDVQSSSTEDNSVEVVLRDLLNRTVQVDTESMSELLSDETSDVVLKELFQYFCERNGYNYDDFVNCDIGLNFNVIPVDAGDGAQFISKKQYPTESGRSGGRNKCLSPPRKRRKKSSPVVEKRMLTRSQYRSSKQYYYEDNSDAELSVENENTKEETMSDADFDNDTKDLDVKDFEIVNTGKDFVELKPSDEALTDLNESCAKQLEDDERAQEMFPDDDDFDGGGDLVIDMDAIESITYEQNIPDKPMEVEAGSTEIGYNMNGKENVSIDKVENIRLTEDSVPGKEILESNSKDDYMDLEDATITTVKDSIEEVSDNVISQKSELNETEVFASEADNLQNYPLKNLADASQGEVDIRDSSTSDTDIEEEVEENLLINSDPVENGGDGVTDSVTQKQVSCENSVTDSPKSKEPEKSSGQATVSVSILQSDSVSGQPKENSEVSQGFDYKDLSSMSRNPEKANNDVVNSSSNNDQEPGIDSPEHQLLAKEGTDCDFRVTEEPDSSTEPEMSINRTSSVVCKDVPVSLQKDETEVPLVVASETVGSTDPNCDSVMFSASCDTLSCAESSVATNCDVEHAAPTETIKLGDVVDSAAVTSQTATVSCDLQKCSEEVATLDPAADRKDVSRPAVETSCSKEAFTVEPNPSINHVVVSEFSACSETAVSSSNVASSNVPLECSKDTGVTDDRFCSAEGVLANSDTGDHPLANHGNVSETPFVIQSESLSEVRHREDEVDLSRIRITEVKSRASIFNDADQAVLKGKSCNRKISQKSRSAPKPGSRSQEPLKLGISLPVIKIKQEKISDEEDNAQEELDLSKVSTLQPLDLSVKGKFPLTEPVPLQLLQPPPAHQNLPKLRSNCSPLPLLRSPDPPSSAKKCKLDTTVIRKSSLISPKTQAILSAQTSNMQKTDSILQRLLLDNERNMKANSTSPIKIPDMSSIAGQVPVIDSITSLQKPTTDSVNSNNPLLYVNGKAVPSEAGPKSHTGQDGRKAAPSLTPTSSPAGLENGQADGEMTVESRISELKAQVRFLNVLAQHKQTELTCINQLRDQKESQLRNLETKYTSICPPVLDPTSCVLPVKPLEKGPSSQSHSQLLSQGSITQGSPKTIVPSHTQKGSSPRKPQLSPALALPGYLTAPNRSSPASRSPESPLVNGISPRSSSSLSSTLNLSTQSRSSPMSKPLSHPSLTHPSLNLLLSSSSSSSPSTRDPKQGLSSPFSNVPSSIGEKSSIRVTSKWSSDNNKKMKKVTDSSHVRANPLQVPNHHQNLSRIPSISTTVAPPTNPIQLPVVPPSILPLQTTASFSTKHASKSTSPGANRRGAYRTQNSSNSAAQKPDTPSKGEATALSNMLTISNLQQSSMNSANPFSHGLDPALFGSYQANFHGLPVIHSSGPAPNPFLPDSLQARILSSQSVAANPMAAYCSFVPPWLDMVGHSFSPMEEVKRLLQTDGKDGPALHPADFLASAAAAAAAVGGPLVGAPLFGAPTCKTCGDPRVKLICGCCRQMWFCGPECQKKFWQNKKKSQKHPEK